MAAINFKKQFVADVESGRKRQTIRALRKKRPIAPGETLYLYTGLRTGPARLLRKEVCISTHSIFIAENGDAILRDELLSEPAKEALAMADGFKGPDAYERLLQFIDKIHGLPFWGVLIKW